MFTGKTKLSEPNEMGYQFGINKSLTEWAHNEQNNWGNILPGIKVTVLEVWKDGNLVSFLLVDEETNQAIDEAAGYEAAAVAIDKHKLIVKSNNID